MTNKKQLCNSVQVYDVDTQNCIFSFSCNECARKQSCSRSKRKRTNCQLGQVINDNLNQIDVRVQVVIGGSTKYYISNKEYEDYIRTKNILLFKKKLIVS